MGVNGRVALVLLSSLFIVFVVSATGEVPDTLQATAPFTFSDPDGLDLDLESLTVRAAVSGPLSLTEMEMVFRNPRNRRTEGRFSCVLPEGAAISRLAKEVNGQLMEGEVVERLRANRIYDEILNQMRDPALLEQDQGNRYAVRIFPIEPNASVRIILSWSRLLPEKDSVRTLTVPIRGLTRVGRFSFIGHFATLPLESTVATTLSGDLEGAAISTTQVVSVEKTDWVPDRDLRYSWPADGKDSILRSGNDWVAILHPSARKVEQTVSTRPLVFYVDTSASAAEGMLHRIRALEILFRSLGDVDVELFAFDHRVEPLLSGRASRVAELLDSALIRRGFLGATNITAMLDHLAGAAREDSNRIFVVVSDGAPTIGSTEPRDVAAAARTLPASAVVHALVLGSRRHDSTLRTITEGRGRIVSVPFSKELGDVARSAASKLLLPLGETVTLVSDAAEFIWPAQARDLRAGEEVIVVGRSTPRHQPSIEIVDTSGTRRQPEVVIGDLPDRFSPLLEREVARGYLDLLARRERDEPVPAIREALIAEQVRVSINSRVVIPRTTLLVLETESDYARFGLDRNAIGQIMTIGAEGIDYIGRRRLPLAAGQPVVRVGEVHGRILHDGVALPGVTVSVQSPALQGVRATATNADGNYRFPALPAGRYEVTMELEGFEKRSQVLTVRPGTITTFEPVSLLLASVSEAITVTAEAREVLETTALSTNFSADTVEELPINRTIQSEEARTEVPASSRASEAITVTAAAPSALETTSVSATVTAAAPTSLETTSISTIITNDGSIRPLPDGASTPGRASGSPSYTRTEQRWHAPEKLALGPLEQAVKNDPLDRAAWSALAEQLALRGEWTRLEEVVRDWQIRDPQNPQVYELIGEAALAKNDRGTAERAVGSLVETATANTELVQRAGLLLFRIGNLDLSESALRLARASRPDRVNGWRHLALVVWQEGHYEEAAAILEDALEHEFSDRQLDVDRVIREELGYVFRDWISADPERRAELERRASALEVDLARRDALRITLAWDTDGNDVDLHVIDPSGEEVFYSHQIAQSGLELYQDVTQGFGPEVVRTASLSSGTYQIGVNYYSVGPMGVSRGIVVVIRDDAAEERVSVEVLPFRLRPDGDSVVKVASLHM